MPLTHRVRRIRQLASGDSKMRERLLDRPHLTRGQVIQVTGVSGHQLHNWVSRKWLTLSGEQSPGKGRRRLYTGRDAINVALGRELQPFGMMKLADLLSRTQQVTSRAYRMLLDPEFECGRAYAVVPSSEGDWRYVAFGPGTSRSGHDFSAAVILDVDRIILETLERLMQLAGSGNIIWDDERPFEHRPQVWSGEIVAHDVGDEYFLNPTPSEHL